jgi:hypothetical protein
MRERLATLIAQTVNVKTFALSAIALFLTVSFSATQELVAEFHRNNRLLATAFATAVEVGIIGLPITIVWRRKYRLETRGFTVLFTALLALSTAANFVVELTLSSPRLTLWTRSSPGGCGGCSRPRLQQPCRLCSSPLRPCWSR